jgi:hypothetical protein
MDFDVPFRFTRNRGFSGQGLSIEFFPSFNAASTDYLALPAT